MDDGHAEADGWRAARDLFLEFSELEEGARRAALHELAARDGALAQAVERLLAHDPGPEPAPTPLRLGPYETVRRIGSGGMGDVYLARRVDGEFEREVAIKLLRPGLLGGELALRFVLERNTLAQLDHEGIARLIDGGTAPLSRPYLVLEYVDGVPLDQYCRDAGLDLAARLRLFQRVLAAVAHAHARGVVHRDLKPSNVLVRKDGAPRLLDFGIARVRDAAAEGLARDLTRTGQRLFTPAYASPEQILGHDVAPASDVFALGVVLYELASGRSPWPDGLAGHELERAVVEHEPAPPTRGLRGALRRGFASDVDTLVLCALAKQPAARYADAAAMAADLERLLDGRPLVARRSGPLARALHRARRRPWLLAAGVGVLVLLGGVWFAAGGDLRRERARAETLGRTVELTVAARAARTEGRVDEAVRMLEEALAALAPFPDEHLRRAEVLGQLAVSLNHRSDFRLALARLDEADREFGGLDVASEADHARVRVSLLGARAYALGEEGRHAEAAAANDAALALARTALPPGHELLVDALLERAARRRVLGDEAGVLAALDEARDGVVAAARERGEPFDELLGSVENERGAALSRAGRHAEALAAYDAALAAYTWHLGDGHPGIATVRANRADALRNLRRHDEALVELGHVLAARRAAGVSGALALALEQLGRTRFEAGDQEGAELALDEARDVMVAYVGPFHEAVRRVEHWRVRLDHARGGDVVGRVRALLDDHRWGGPLDPEYAAALRAMLPE
jgi:serine/threonine-protein kinase